ncbi:MAG: FG-GAP repeat protein [Verrucomicrobiaceae bacterium]|nr:FG-GAP repeat protein [Verrucomicrobiaceae bacterium]
MTSPLPFRLAAMIALLASLLATPSPAIDRTAQKLFGKWSRPPASYLLGNDINSAALSPKWVVLGASAAADRGEANEGAVQVFSASSRAFVRKLLPPGAPAPTQRFGCAVAVSGDLALVGSYGTAASRGAAYLFHLGTGRLLRTLTADDGAAPDAFGTSVALSRDLAIVSAPSQNGNRGAIYLFNVSTGAQIAKILAFDGGPNYFFGRGLALEGNIIAAGADGANANKGAVYFFDAAAQTLIKKYQPVSWAPNDYFGSSIAMHQGRVIIGTLLTSQAWGHDLFRDTAFAITRGGSSVTFGSAVAVYGPIMAVSDFGVGLGVVHLYNAISGAFLETIVPPNGDPNPQRFGHAIALDGNTLLASAPNDSVQDANAGAAHLIQPILRPLNYNPAVTQGTFAPGAPDINYGTIREAFINDGGVVLFNAALTGAGANRNRDTAAFADMDTLGNQELLVKSRQTFDTDIIYGAISRITSNDKNLVIGAATLTGRGVNGTNNQAIWYQSSTASGYLLRTGTGIPIFIGAILKSVPEFVTNDLVGGQRCAAICTLRTGAGTNATNDSGLWVSTVGTSIEAKREGDATIAPLPAGNLGQFTPRLCYATQQHVYSTALVGANFSTFSNAAIFRRARGAAEQLVARRDDIAVNESGGALPNARYSSFIGETADSVGPSCGVVYRAGLRIGGATTAANNEGLWRYDGTGIRRLVLRKGQVLDNPTGLKIARFIQFWATGDDLPFDQVLALVRLSGPGVNANNDQALLLWQTDGTFNLLIREGDPAPGCPDAKIGVITRVEVEPTSSRYALTATLSGATASDNLALYVGNLLQGNTTNLAALRRPFLRLRKGQVFDNQPSKIKSLSLPLTNITPSGAGGTGRSRAITYSGYFAFIVEFDNRVRQILKGFAN